MRPKEEKWLLEEKYAGVPSGAYLADLARLRAGEPVAYVIGTVPFLGLTVRLDSLPLIPRPETEWWTERLIETLPSGARVLDVCAGSGAIGAAILSRAPESRVWFGEIDPAHEATIRATIRGNGLDESRASVRIGDLFAPFSGMRFDAIAANPPYVPLGRTLDHSVIGYEPALALFAGADGLAVIRRIARDAPKCLAEGGALWMEVDAGHASEAARIAADAGLAPTVLADQYGLPRVIVARPVP